MKKVDRWGARITSFMLLLSMSSTGLARVALAEDKFAVEQKIYCSATINDVFADDSIIVVLDNEASLDYLQTEKIDFPEIKHKRTRNLSNARGKQIKNMVDERKNASFLERTFTNDPNANEIATYQQVLCIELQEAGKDKVLEAIALLEQRDDVLF